ncbi:MAG: hypothetical protein QW456_07140 [Ignisphaera sp.]
MGSGKRTASVIPSVILSVAVVLVISLILGGVIQYYTSIVNEPPVLPTYGSLYVLEADRRTGIVKVMNRFGYPVKALFSISLDTNRIAADMNLSVTPIVSFWLTLGPGETTVDVYQYLKSYLGTIKPEYVRWDESGFLVGNTFFPLQRGAGARIPPGPPASLLERQYTLTGIGTSYVVPRSVFATKYFDGDKLSVEFTHSLKLGYRRSICGYREVTVITTYRHGRICAPCLCTLEGCAEYNCTKYENDTCVEWNCTNTGYTYYRCDSTTEPMNDYNTYSCGLDGQVCDYWTPHIDTVSSVDIHSLSLRGLINDPSGFAVDRKNMSLPRLSATATWEYILPQEQQSQCIYRYREESYWTSFSYSQVCCPLCLNNTRLCVTESVCNHSYVVVHTSERHACQHTLGNRWLCAGLDTFLSVELDSSIVTVEVRQVFSDIAVRFNMTFTYKYTRYYDPELNDSYVRVAPLYIFSLKLPPVRGYISIPYNENLSNASSFVSVNLVKSSVNLRTESGYVNNHPPVEVVLIKWSNPISTTPIGYVAIEPSGSVESAKTFSFTTTSQPTVYVVLRHLGNPYITVPMCPLSCNSFGCSCSDTITINAVVEVTLNVGVTLITTILS